MSFPMRILSVFALVMILGGTSIAEIKEKQIDSYRRIFLSKVLKDNKGSGKSIRRSMNGIIRQGSAGVRIVDKFALFLYDSRKNRLSLEKVKFSSNGRAVSFFIIMKDLSDGQLYNLYVEYLHTARGRSYRIGDLYFSTVFMDRIKSVKDFFGGD